MPVSAKEAQGYFQASGFRVLPIESDHTLAVEGLPPLHQDPFDRLLVAQALTEPMRLVTHDPVVARYSDTIIEV
jgi:PIN domain nuclease of toxin-antitoxin system